MKRFLTLLLSTTLAVSCNWCEQEKADRHVVLMYISCHNNGLSSYSVRQLQELQTSGNLPSSSDGSNIFLVYSHLAGSAPELSRYSQDRNGEFVKEVIQTYPDDTESVRAEQVAAVVSQAQTAYPAGHYTLVLSSHASSFLLAGTKAAPLLPEERPIAVNSFGPDNDVEVNIDALAAALSPYHFDCLLFDCCYMAGVEVCYEFRNIADYVIGSVTEVMASGIFKSPLLLCMFDRANPQAAMVTAGEEFMKIVRGDSSYSNSGLISVVKSSELEKLAAQARPLFAAHQEEISRLNRSAVQSYRGAVNYGCLYDLGDFIDHIATEQEAAAFRAALDKAVIFKDATPTFLGYAITKHSGLSTYIPRPDKVSLNDYYRTLGWNKATGLLP